MTAGSNINSNYPIPGIDQSSKGFRDNFSIIKKEITDLQSKQLIFTGALAGTQSMIFDSGPGPIIVPGVVNASNLQIANNTVGAVVYLDSHLNFTAAYNLFNYNAVSNSVHLRGVNANKSLTFTTDANDAVVASSGNLQLMVNDSVSVIYASDSGAVGINNTVPYAQLDVRSPTYMPAQFYSGLDTSDNAVRFTTDQPSATIGLVLEQRSADTVGGIRIGTDGTISLHSGEPMDAGLSDTSKRLVILPSGEIGINNAVPTYALDVNGDIATTNLWVGTSINYPDGTKSTSASLLGQRQQITASNVNMAGTTVNLASTSMLSITDGLPIHLKSTIRLAGTQVGTVALTTVTGTGWLATLQSDNDFVLYHSNGGVQTALASQFISRVGTNAVYTIELIITPDSVDGATVAANLVGLTSISLNQDATLDPTTGSWYMGIGYGSGSLSDIKLASYTIG